MAYKARSDRTLFIVTSLLTVFGVIMVYNASSAMASDQHGMSSYYFLKQIVFAVIGFGLMILLMNVGYHFWQRKTSLVVLFLLGVVGLAAVFAMPEVNGAHRWLRYGGLISFQPSEFAKLSVVIFTAAFLHKYEKEMNRWWSRLLPFLGVVMLIAGLIAAEPDLGQAICIVFIVSFLLFIGGLSWKYVGLLGALSLPVFYFMVMRVPFRWERIISYFHPFHDPLGASWQILQSLTAVGSGGIFGLGFGASKQKGYFLPEPHSDFIFAVIGEEIGLVGTTLVCLTFLVYFLRGIRTTLRAPDSFGHYLALGITLMIVVQALINISMVLALLPTKGIALPFISQGGSSLLISLAATGILLNISHYAEKA
jgi:cell division protein FtsW